MDKHTLKALKGSIAKWEAIVAGTGEDLGPDNCPLCQMFLDKDRVSGVCEGCPVKESTKKSNCQGTPYEKFESLDIELECTHPEAEPEYGEIKNARQEWAMAELVFLKSLLPIEEPTHG